MVMVSRVVVCVIELLIFEVMLVWCLFIVFIIVVVSGVMFMVIFRFSISIVGKNVV